VKFENRNKPKIEAACSKLQGIFDRKECGLLLVRSLPPPQAAGNALAFAAQISNYFKDISNLARLNIRICFAFQYSNFGFPFPALQATTP
jgi:hypothetical protein